MKLMRRQVWPLFVASGIFAPLAQAHPGDAPHIHPFTLGGGWLVAAIIGLSAAWFLLRRKTVEIDGGE